MGIFCTNDTNNIYRMSRNTVFPKKFGSTWVLLPNLDNEVGRGPNNDNRLSNRFHVFSVLDLSAQDLQSNNVTHESCVTLLAPLPMLVMAVVVAHWFQPRLIHSRQILLVLMTRIRIWLCNVRLRMFTILSLKKE